MITLTFLLLLTLALPLLFVLVFFQVITTSFGKFGAPLVTLP